MLIIVLMEEHLAETKMFQTGGCHTLKKLFPAGGSHFIVVSRRGASEP